MKELTAYLYGMSFILLFFASRLAGYLHERAEENEPFKNYKSTTEFYIKNVLYGLFLTKPMGAIPWFIFKKSDDKKNQTLYIIVNIITAVFYFLIVFIGLFMYFNRHQL